MNRCWDANFVHYYTSRNYTGRKAFNAPEAVALKNFITERAGSKTNIVLDIHGWLNKTYGNSEVGAYFGQQFGFSHRSTYGNGYLETWAYLKGYKSCLVELPMPKSSSSITSNNYVGKLTAGLVNMISNISGDSSPEGGTVTNELCQIKTNSSVNVRSGPGTSYSKIASLENGTKVTRIKKGVANANGYTWDKIKLSDGKIGYVATNYLVVVVDDYGYIYNNLYDDVAVIKAYLKYETGFYEDKVVDKSYNWELTDALEEYQKIYSLNLQDGTINNETLNHMGFSVNAYNKIENNSFYKKYRRISEIYNDNDLYQIYIYDVNFDDETSEPRYITFGKSTSVTDSHYNKTKNTEDSYYGTYYELEENKKHMPTEKELEKTEENIEKLISMFSEDYPRSALAFQNYKNNTGETLNFGEIKSIFDLPNQKKLRNIQIERCMKASEKYLTDGLVDVKMAFENYYTTTIWSINSGTPSEVQLDWYAAANSLSIGVSSETIKSGNKYTMTTTFSMRDYYDWGNSVFIFPNLEVPNIKEKDLKDLHYCGRAKNFESVGNDYVIKTVWNEGQTIDQATILVISY